MKLLRCRVVHRCAWRELVRRRRMKGIPPVSSPASVAKRSRPVLASRYATGRLLRRFRWAMNTFAAWRMENGWGKGMGNAAMDGDERWQGSCHWPRPPTDTPCRFHCGARTHFPSASTTGLAPYLLRPVRRNVTGARQLRRAIDLALVSELWPTSSSLALFSLALPCRLPLPFPNRSLTNTKANTSRNVGA